MAADVWVNGGFERVFSMKKPYRPFLHSKEEGRGLLFIKLLYKCPFNPLNKPVMWELCTPFMHMREAGNPLSPELVSCETGSAT